MDERQYNSPFSTRYGSKQVKNYCWHIRKKYGAPQIL